MKTSTIIISVVVVIVIAAAVFFAMNGGSKSANTTNANADVAQQTTQANANTINTSPSASEVVIELNASRFQYSPGTITVHKGDHVKIVINNIDTTHGISIPDYNVQGISGVEFTADKAGTFQFHCPTVCGSGHRDMVGTLIVQ